MRTDVAWSVALEAPIYNFDAVNFECVLGIIIVPKKNPEKAFNFHRQNIYKCKKWAVMQEATGLLQATVDRTTAISYGDTVSLSGKLALPQAFKTQTGKDFDYPEYLRAKGIGAVMVYPTLVVTEHAHISFFGMLYTIKHALEHAIEISIPEPAAGLLEGILLGNRTALGDALYTIFIIAELVPLESMMNNSGTAVAALIKNQKEAEKLVVIHEIQRYAVDDLEINKIGEAQYWINNQEGNHGGS
jgi:hypothetical protein